MNTRKGRTKPGLARPPHTAHKFREQFVEALNILREPIDDDDSSRATMTDAHVMHFVATAKSLGTMVAEPSTEKSVTG